MQNMNCSSLQTIFSLLKLKFDFKSQVINHLSLEYDFTKYKPHTKLYISRCF